MKGLLDAVWRCCFVPAAIDSLENIAQIARRKLRGRYNCNLGRISSDAMWRLSVAWAIGRTPVEHRQTLPGPVRRAYTEAKGYGLTLRNKHDTFYSHSVMALQSSSLYISLTSLTEVIRICNGYLKFAQ